MDSPATIEIRGKTYAAQFTADTVSLFRLQRVGMFERAMMEARKDFYADATDDVKAEKYRKTWLDYCREILTGDVSDLDVDKLSVNDEKELLGFFHERAGEAIQPFKDGSPTSPDSTRPDQVESSPTLTKSTG